MAGALKRASEARDASSCKRIKPNTRDSPVRRDLLDRCYSGVTTLREHVLSELPSASRLRRKKILAIGRTPDPGEADIRLAHLLETTLVCAHDLQANTDDTRWEQWLSFSQKGDESYVTISNGLAACVFSQSEIVDFVVWLLFSRESKTGGRPKHLLCDGFRKSANPGDHHGSTIPGLFSRHPNSHVKALRETPWPQLLALLGKSGEKIMIDLLLDHAIYIPVEAGFQNYRQLSGIPLSEHDLSANSHKFGARKPPGSRKPGDITLVRSRIFYAKPALTARGLVRPGFKHIHVLNRCPYTKDSAEGDSDPHAKQNGVVQSGLNTVKVMMYIFPRQFGLHNVFTSQVDTAQTAQKFQDYTLRETEIASVLWTPSVGAKFPLPKIPKRLRGQAEQLVRGLQIRHNRCSYLELLRHHCPCVFDALARPRKAKSKKELGALRKGNRSTQLPSSESTQVRSTAKCYSRKKSSLALPPYKSVVDLALPASRVSAFCRAVLAKIIPNEFWGDGSTQVHNRALFLRKVDHFINLRRFETMSLHEIAQGLKVANISWLQPLGQQNHKPSKTDTNKRHEIFYEFLYYIFDSLLMPLIRSNFYVTESNSHRYQIFYFRHEVWRHIAEPSMAALKANMFEEVKLDDAKQILESRRLGFSQIRLLPKGDKLRPIMNLRRRTLARGKSKTLGPSINSILDPIHKMMKLEKVIHPFKLGSAMFSVNDIYNRLKIFKESLGAGWGRLYFAKLDVQAAFDTIPQGAVMDLMKSIPSQTRYTITKHAEVKPGERPVVEADKAATKAIRRWHATALAKGAASTFVDRLETDLACKKKNTVFVDMAIKQTHHTQDLLSLLNEHVQQNLVKVGKKYYRQKKGIPQGSVVSSFLCNYFYADLENQHLGFLNSSDCLLLRLIDDFLLVTLDKAKATRFVETMHPGLPEYGVEVNPKKTLVNFDMSIDGEAIRRVEDGEKFPYCGTLIDCQTLEISKDRQRDRELDITASLTIDFGRAPGQNFQRKVLNAFKIQSHLMFFDTAHNSTQAVMDSLRGAFVETANKMWAYLRCLAKAKQPSSSLVIRTITKVVDVAFLLLTGKSRAMRYPQYRCDIRKTQVALIACVTFTKVLSQKQTKYNQVIKWLRAETGRLASEKERKA